MSNLLLSGEILNSIWAIDPRSVQAYLPAVAQILNGDKASFGDIKEIRKENEKANAPAIVTFEGADVESNGYKVNYSGDLSSAPEGSIAIISYSGVVRMKGGMSNKGTEDTRKELQLAGSNPNIKAVLFSGHSGGGSVFGTESLSNDIRDFEKNYSKPLAAIVQDQACSAMYWIMSGAPMIFGAGKSCEVGCIGTMTTFFNYKEMLASQGLEEVVVRASKSFNKNEEYYQAMLGNTEPLQKNILDPLNNAFLSAVKANRRGKIDLTKKVKNEDGSEVAEVLSGKTYYGQKNVEVGLIDKIGSQSDAIKYLSREAKKYKTVKSSSSSKNTKRMTIKNYTKLTDEALSAEITNLEASVPLATEENFESHNTMLDLAKTEQAKRTAENQVATLTQENKDLKENDNTEDLTAQVTTLTQERDDAQADATAKGTQVETLTTDLATATQERDDHKATIDTMTAEADKKDKKIAAHEEFLNAEYGEGTADKFVADSNGEIAQPEAVESKVVYKSSAERLADADKEARSMIDSMGKKKED